MHIFDNLDKPIDKITDLSPVAITRTTNLNQPKQVQQVPRDRTPLSKSKVPNCTPISTVPPPSKKQSSQKTFVMNSNQSI